MNIYDTKVIHCAICEKCIGEADYDAEIIFPKCGKCANPLPAIHQEQVTDVIRTENKESIVLIH